MKTETVRCPEILIATDCQYALGSGPKKARFQFLESIENASSWQSQKRSRIQALPGRIPTALSFLISVRVPEEASRAARNRDPH
jgi:hypothetical protein